MFRHVKEGQAVKQFDKIAEVQSDKANVEITSRYDGVIKKLHYDVGATAKVGSALVDIDVEGEVEGESDVVIEDSVQLSEELRDDVIPSTSDVIGSSKDYGTGSADFKALPSVRRKAREMGIDLSQIKPTGKFNQITLADLEGHQTTKMPMENISRVVPLSMFQKAMIKSMTESIKIPHFGFHDEIAMDRLMTVRAELNLNSATVKLTPLPFLVKAMSMALAEFPQLNGNFNPTTNELTRFSHHNIGVAVDTPHGLAVPVIKDVASKSVHDIAKELNRLTELARSNKLPSSDMKGATMSISNIGTIGGTTASPIIPFPQLAIVALGRTQRLPRFDANGIVTGVSLMPISWSADHRVVDGATIAKFSQRWKQLVESPSKLLV